LRGTEVNLETKTAFRIAVIGSSYTYGWGVAEENCFVHVLGEALNDAGIAVEMINLGRNGSTPSHYAMLAEELIPLLKPDLVIIAVGQGCDLRWSGPLAISEWYPLVFWRYFPNLATLAHMMRTPDIAHPTMPTSIPTDEEMKTRKEYNKKEAQLHYKQYTPEQKKCFDALNTTVKEAYFSGSIHLGVVDLAMKSPDLYTGALDLSQYILRINYYFLKKRLAAIARAAKKEGSQTLVVSVPFGAYVNRPAWENTGRMGFDVTPEMLSSTVMDNSIQESAKGLPFFSATDVFRKEMNAPDLFFAFDLHMAAKGHRLFAQTIAPWVKNFVHSKRSNG
jgi:hypothetical protein